MTLEEIQTDLAMFRVARAKILEGAQAYTIGMRSFTKADLAEINAEIHRLESKENAAKSGGMRMRSGVPQ